MISRWQYAKNFTLKQNRKDKTLTDASWNKRNLRWNKKMRTKEYCKAKSFSRRRCVNR